MYILGEIEVICERSLLMVSQMLFSWRRCCAVERRMECLRILCYKDRAIFERSNPNQLYVYRCLQIMVNNGQWHIFLLICIFQSWLENISAWTCLYQGNVVRYPSIIGSISTTMKSMDELKTSRHYKIRG